MHILAKLGQENLRRMVGWVRWHCAPWQTQDSKFDPWRSEAENATSRSRRLRLILNLYESAGNNDFVSLKPECQSGERTRDPRLSKRAASTTAPRFPPDVLKCTHFTYWWFASLVLGFQRVKVPDSSPRRIDPINATDLCNHNKKQIPYFLCRTT